MYTEKLDRQKCLLITQKIHDVLDSYSQIRYLCNNGRAKQNLAESIINGQEHKYFAELLTNNNKKKVRH